MKDHAFGKEFTSSLDHFLFIKEGRNGDIIIVFVLSFPPR